MTDTLQGRVVVVTGGTRGIGLVMAQSLTAAGATVVLGSRSARTAKITPQTLNLDPQQTLILPCDITNFKQVEQLAKRTIDRFGTIDVWFNNAAINRYFGPLLELPIDHWHAVINTNLTGTYYGTIVALRHMLPRNQGKIINLLGAGSSDSPGNSYLSAYATSKAAVRRFTAVVAEDYRHTNLSILAFNPGLSATDLTTQIQPVTPEAKQRLKILEWGLKWLATSPPAIGKMAVYLASSATDGKTGKTYRCWPGLIENWQRQGTQSAQSVNSKTTGV